MNNNKKSIKEIKAAFEAATLDNWNNLFDEYADDERSGVAKLIQTYKNKQEKEFAEDRRLEKMLEFERKYGNDFQYICGIDEAGRGPFAGPVVAGAVILPKDLKIRGLNDSKKVNPQKREELFEEIKEKALSVGIGIASPSRIDQINILQATYEAMKHAIEDLDLIPDLLLNDAVTIPQVPIKQIGIIKGDARSLSIAAASIIAKVTRDRMMIEMSDLYPEYNFEKNKGYGSKEHIEALKKYGPCPIHRSTFIHSYV